MCAQGSHSRKLNFKKDSGHPVPMAARETRTQDCVGAVSQNRFCLGDFRSKLPMKGVSIADLKTRVP